MKGLRETIAVSSARFQSFRATSVPVVKPCHEIDPDGRRVVRRFSEAEP